ncbi:MAG TPA: hypothetical protein VND21_06775 [Planctomycetota bacterium]|nr:hypothetical protein [Planctomycetota bacterium]
MDRLPRSRRSPVAQARIALVCGVVVALVACGDPEAPPPRGTPAAIAGDRGRIVGICRLVGTPTPVKLREWPGMGIEAGQDDESVRTGEGRALGGCVVTVDVGRPSRTAQAAPPPDATFTLTAVSGRFAPHVAIAHAPVQLVLESRLERDLVVHGYDARTRETAFNLALSPGAALRDVGQLYLQRPGVYWVTDDLRGHFTAWIHVVSTPHVDLTTAEAREGIPAGGYRLEGVPPGRRVLRCWHEPMDRRDQPLSSGYVLGPPIEIVRTVEVAAGREVRVDFDVVHPTDADAPAGR